MPNEELLRAFDDAERRVERALAQPMRDRDGRDATPHLALLQRALADERAQAMATGRVRPEWARTVIRQVSEWTPDDELTLIGALGRIVRAGQ